VETNTKKVLKLKDGTLRLPNPKVLVHIPKDLATLHVHTTIGRGFPDGVDLVTAHR
jgi:hypothetical protein